MNSLTKEKRFFYAVNEWKSNQVKMVVIVRVLYGLKYSAFELRNHFFKILGNNFGLQSFSDDPEVWLKAATDKTGNKYYTYTLVYVDDLLIVEK